MKILLKNAQRLHESGQLKRCDVFIEHQHIKFIERSITASADRVIDCEGHMLIPGLIDVHVHLREPGGENKETIQTGTKAAAKGGFTTICAMPNTTPVPDDTRSVEQLIAIINKDAFVRVLPYASITKGQKGNELSPIGKLSKAGVFAFTDDGVGIQKAAKMFEAMHEAAKHNQSIVAHCEDDSLQNGGVVHEGNVSERLDLPGIPSVSESIHIARDLLLAEATGCHYHVCHVSTKESVRVIREAKKAGIHVTAEVTPHHLLLNENDITHHDAQFKMNPPLRTKEDQDALLNGLLDNTIDIIATDHAPHHVEEKKLGFLKAPFGIVGLETAFPLLYTHLVETGKMTIHQLVDRFTRRPAGIFGLPYGTLKEGQIADITLVDLQNEKMINRNEFYSKGQNTPFHGWIVKGWPILTIASGDIVYKDKD